MLVDADGRGYGELSEALKGEFSQPVKADEDGRFSLTSDWQEWTMKVGVLDEKGAGDAENHDGG